MNKYFEIRKRPRFSYKIQLYANDYPSWSKARDDKHSNYQTVLNDLTSVVSDAQSNVVFQSNKLYLLPYDCFDSQFYYKFVSNDLEIEETETTSTFKKPSSVIGTAGWLNSPAILTENQSPSLEDLQNRLPLSIKNEVSTPISVFDISNEMENSWPNKKIYFSVYEKCFIGFRLKPKVPWTNLTSDPFNVEDFNYLERNSAGVITVYTKSLVYLKFKNGDDIGTIELDPLEVNLFKYPIHPGDYYLEFDLMNPNQLDNYDIELFYNYFMETDYKNMPGPVIIPKQGLVISSTIEINDEYLEYVYRDIFNNKEKEIYESFLLLEEDGEELVPLSAETWTKKENIIFVKKGNKLYLYDSYTDGADYIYTNSEKNDIKLVCEDINYKVNDYINLETRMSSYVLDETVNSVRLRVQNFESGEDTYVDKTGNTGPYVWRDLTINGNPAEELNMIKWKINLPYIGSYKFTLEGSTNSNKIITIGEKIILVNYKIPFKVFTLSEDYEGYLLGTSPDGDIQLLSSDKENLVIINFWKDGYYFDSETGNIWTNAPFTSLEIVYED